MGLTLGVMGGGGSILTVPIFVYIFKIDPMLATAYSLFVVGSTALVGGLFYFKRGEVDLKTGFTFAIPSFTAVFLVRSQVVPRLPIEILSIGSFHLTKPVLIMLLFSILMLLASTAMIRKRKLSTAAEMNAMKRTLTIASQGLMVGSVTGFVGAGGGFLIVPALVILVGLSMRVAVGTSLLIIAVNSLIGFTGDINQQAFIDWGLITSVAAIAILGLLAGTTLAKRVPEDKLQKGFGYFVLVMGSLILIDQISKL
jgi:uncharacterized membrane protein YfcA